MTRVTRVTAEQVCAICERTLLMGERSIRFSPDGGSEYVDVCLLCQDIALEHGWIREGSPTSPMVPAERRRKSGGFSFGSLLKPRPRSADAPVAGEPILRRLSEPERAVVEAADLFNASQYRRTVAGVGKSLGPARVSIVPLSGVNAAVVVTVAWDISWYQYRVSLDMEHAVRLEERGHDPSELEATFTDWNAHMEDDGRIVPDIARL
jgi:hypothetical protein